jgi:hypothetical protein
MVTPVVSISVSSGWETSTVSARLAKLLNTISARRSRVSCLRRWSEFIRERDGHRCVDCHATKRLSAHHICRKSLFEAAQYDTGNGITLCRECHREVHAGFNGRPDMSLPVDAQGGEKLACMERLYSILLDDAVERGLMCEDFYFLSEEVLGTLKKMLGYDSSACFPGSRLEQAYLILAEPESQMRHAIADANGFRLSGDPLLPGGLMIVINEDVGRQPSMVVLQGYSRRSKAPDQSDLDD